MLHWCGRPQHHGIDMCFISDSINISGKDHVMCNEQVHQKQQHKKTLHCITVSVTVPVAHHVTVQPQRNETLQCMTVTTIPVLTA